ncbi:MAG: YbjQ family protein [Erysipelotrichaceae bacterium]|nr:YbjQ family protein [Erysipelotrichaceae bacterium]
MMIITTTSNVDGMMIKEYKGIVFGEVVEGIDLFRDIAAGFTNLFGGRSNSYENAMVESRQSAIQDMVNKAERLGANAIVGVRVDYEVINNMLMITASGTAVFVD